MKPERGRGRATLIIVLLTIAWVITCAGLLVANAWVGIGGIGAGDLEVLRAIRREQATLELWFAAVGAGGPVAIGVVALALRRVVTGWVFVTLAVLLAVPAAITGQEGWDRLHPTSTVEPDLPTHCVERSGGDTRCPGG
jgi:hypothetical protein